jgi:hypothetical protein
MLHLVLVSRILAVVAAAMFLLVLTGGTLPGAPEGRWTFVALWAVGLAMHKVGEFRDHRGSPRRFPGPSWLRAVLTILGIVSVGLLAGVAAGFDARTGAALLAAIMAAKWLLVFIESTLRTGLGARLVRAHRSERRVHRCRSRVWPAVHARSDHGVVSHERGQARAGSGAWSASGRPECPCRLRPGRRRGPGRSNDLRLLDGSPGGPRKPGWPREYSDERRSDTPHDASQSDEPTLRGRAESMCAIPVTSSLRPGPGTEGHEGDGVARQGDEKELDG